MIPGYRKTGRQMDGKDIYRIETDREAIFYALSWYRLFNCEGSVSDWYGGCGDFDKDDLYFIDPGKTLNDAFLSFRKDGSQPTATKTPISGPLL